ncbi:hypothetical protein QS306_09490 [Paraburkholderia bonniea]|uniref:hypothetical protein n=1 Tax=Paraburkholderia bonniea TaxID=2152891 RepID=UPI001290DE47|nr:hypothetical protein [Paraburkholderia bonniea]WJF89355.1 hypothetical protein QS306_09490 [Paraburkholderia bonniea]WJF92670.1 hypothetical protein QS308_09500 [Paraburkholderia bonniea]
MSAISHTHHAAIAPGNDTAQDDPHVSAQQQALNDALENYAAQSMFRHYMKMRARLKESFQETLGDA